MPKPNTILIFRPFHSFGLALAVAALVAFPVMAAPDWPHTEVINVVVMEDIFAPSHLVFRTGVAYRLHIENQGEELHKFEAPDFFHAVEIHTPAVLNAERSEIDAPAGELRDFLFVVGRPGSFKLRSPDYDWNGMTGDIVITP
jgi:hypothetical protein